jgi:hypothetical protein
MKYETAVVVMKFLRVPVFDFDNKSVHYTRYTHLKSQKENKCTG